MAVELNKTNFHWAESAAKKFQESLISEVVDESPEEQEQDDSDLNKNQVESSPAPPSTPAPAPAPASTPAPISTSAPISTPAPAPPVNTPNYEAIELQLANTRLAEMQAKLAQLEEEKRLADSRMAEYDDLASKVKEYEYAKAMSLPDAEELDLQGIDPDDAKKLLAWSQKQLQAALAAGKDSSKAEIAMLTDRLAKAEKFAADIQINEQKRRMDDLRRRTNEALYAAIPNINELQASPEFDAWARKPIAPNDTETNGQRIRKLYDSGNAAGVIGRMQEFISGQPPIGVEPEMLRVVPDSSVTGAEPAQGTPEVLVDDDFNMLRELNNKIRLGMISQSEYSKQLAAYRKKTGFKN